MKKLLVSFAIGCSAVLLGGIGTGSADVSVDASVCPKVNVVVAGQPVNSSSCVPISTTIPTP